MIFVFLASKSRTGGGIYFQYPSEKNPGSEERKRNISSSLWKGRRMPHKWSLQKTQSGNKYIEHFAGYDINDMGIFLALLLLDVDRLCLFWVENIAISLFHYSERITIIGVNIIEQIKLKSNFKT